MASTQIAICLLTNEPEYLEEWLEHHRKYGFDHFILYLDKCDVPELKGDCTKILCNSTNSPNYQMRLYEDCCRRFNNFDYILFIDSDEFYESNSKSVHEDIRVLKENIGEFDGLGLYWRMYGKSKPYFEDRKPVEEYVEWYENQHIKSFVNPKSVFVFQNPHKAMLKMSSDYIDELGRNVTSALGHHTSKNMWIKHIWTRSLGEWKNKVSRRGWYEFYNRKLEQFYEHNDQCKLH